MFKNLTYLLDY